MSFKLSAEGVGEWRRHWTVVLAAALGVTVMSAPPYSMGIFIPALEEALGWKRAAIASGMMISAVAAITLGPLVGAAVDRYGPRWIGIVGAALVCTAFAAMSLAGPALWTWWLLWAFMGLAAVLVLPMVWTGAISSLFNASRGLALAVTLCGASIAAIATPLLCGELIEKFGWRAAYLGLAAFLAVLVLPTLILLFKSPLDRWRAGDASEPGASPEPIEGDTPREAFRSGFPRLLGGAMAISLVAPNSTVNLVPILTSTGHAPMAAASIAGLAGISTIAGRLIGGVLLDRFNGNVVAAGSTALPIFSSLLLLLFPGSTWAAMAAAVILGLCVGSELDAVSYLLSRHFGMRSFGVLMGFIGAGLSVTIACGPIALNAVYDLTGSYGPGLWAFLPICVVGSALFLSLGPYRYGEVAGAADKELARSAG